jgi:hypothetical protein
MDRLAATGTLEAAEAPSKTPAMVKSEQEDRAPWQMDSKPIAVGPWAEAVTEAEMEAQEHTTSTRMDTPGVQEEGSAEDLGDATLQTIILTGKTVRIPVLAEAVVELTPL